MRRGRLHLGMSIRGLGYHPAAWRHPDVPADGTLRFEHYARNAQLAEQGMCDLIFFADGIGIREHDIPRGSLARSGYEIVEMEPLTLLPALAVVTKHIGLVTTASTTYNEPFNIARKFATLDLISNGRSGWNVVTSWSEAEARNFNREQHVDYGTRYARAAEFVEVVKGLWDSWDEDAFRFDKQSGWFFDEGKMHVLDHKGKFFAVRGPLNVACPPQGHPVIVQAVGRTAAEAQAKFDQLQELLDPLVGLARLNQTFGDLSGYPLDGPVPLDKLGPGELRSISAQLVERVKRQNPSIRDLYGEVAGRGGFCVIGTAADIADVMQDWFAHDACDGFNITPTHLPGGCQDFVEMVTPELQRRGLFRTEYEGTTLRENLGLKRPANRYTTERRA
jgi:alkanesulfonate monooxygenase SsuD/methylene tetrahydromethanopterin reductase-like flavin-dependent oxidoreductase (luciferase family)